MRARLLPRLRAAAPTAVLAVAVYLPLLLTRPGRVGGDTKTYLYLDPGRLLDRATSMWDPHIGMGTVTHQNIGYLWPIGPYYWAMDALGAPDWVAQRIWLGSILVLAGVGVRFLLRTLGQEGPHVTAATFCYAFTPYVLTLGSRLSVILLPFAGLPWLIALTARSLRHRSWRDPALFALVVATVGSVNATALILAGFGPLLWVLHEVLVTREVRVRDAAAAVGRIAVLTVGCSLWWLAGLWAQSGYGIEILRYTETAETVAAASVSLEVLRGLGYWFFYGEDTYGPWIEASRAYMRRPELVLVSFLVPLLGVVGAAVARFRERTFFAALLVVGVLLAVGGHPWDDGPPLAAGFRWVLESDAGLAMRSLPRAAPLVALSLAVFAGSLVAALTAHRERLARPVAAGVVVLAVLALPPLWRRQVVDPNLDRHEDLPAYWAQAASALDARDDGTRVLEVPGSDFASYRWGNTVDPVLPGLMDRPYVARELIPYGSAASADLLDALDRRIQEGTLDPAAFAPVARFMGVGDVSVRSDLSYERYNTPRPRLLWDLLRNAPGMDEVAGFGPREPNVPRADLPLLDEAELLAPPSLPDPPEVGVLAVDDAEPIVRTAPDRSPVVMAGDGEGVVDAAAAGLLTGHELLLYSASFAGDEDRLRTQLDRDAALVLTDTNRRRARRWGTVRDTTGLTERAGQEPVREDPKDQRLEVFPGAGDDHATVTVERGGVWADATSYGNTVSLTPEDGPDGAVDGELGTSWRTGGFADARGEVIRLHYREPVTTDGLRVLQAIGGARNRFITEVEVRLDDGAPLTFELGERSRAEGEAARGPDAGQRLEFPTTTFSTVDVTITATDADDRYRFDGLSGVGFAEIVAVDEDGSRPVGDAVVRMPTDLLDVAGAAAADHDLAVVMTRSRTAPTVAVRSDPEPRLRRTFALPGERSFAVTGSVRLSSRAADDVLDAALGVPGADEGGLTATSRRRLPGGPVNRASSAVDGDPDTWYSPGFLGQQLEYVDVRLPEGRPATFDRMAITVLADGRHSVPRGLFLEVDGRVVQEIDLPAVDDQPEPNARHTFDVSLDRSVTGTQIRVAVRDEPEAVREVRTLDWYSGNEIVMPVGIVELGIDGIRAPAVPERIDPACRTDLVEVDGRPTPVSVRGTTEDLLAGRSVDLVGCTALDLPSGDATVETVDGAGTGLDVDRLVLRSDAGGAASDASGPLVDGSDRRPRVEIRSQDRTSLDLTVHGTGEPFWLVLGQSHNAGWRAEAAGRDLGGSTLVDGYANGWLVPAADGPVRIHVEWTPQRVVDGALLASLLAVAITLVLAAWPRRTTAPGDPTWVPLDARPAMPLPAAAARLVRYAGPLPSRVAVVATTAGAVLAGWVAIGPWSAAVLGVAAVAGTRLARARPLLTVGGPLLLVGSVAWMVVRVVVDAPPPGFDWPTYFGSLHRPALLAIGLVALDVVVDRCWLRRWWPTRNSPT